MPTKKNSPTKNKKTISAKPKVSAGRILLIMVVVLFASIGSFYFGLIYGKGQAYDEFKNIKVKSTVAETKVSVNQAIITESEEAIPVEKYMYDNGFDQQEITDSKPSTITKDTDIAKTKLQEEGAAWDEIKYEIPEGWKSKHVDNEGDGEDLHFWGNDGGYVSIDIYDFDPSIGRRTYFCNYMPWGFCIQGVTKFEKFKLGNITGYYANPVDASGSGPIYFGAKGNKFYLITTMTPPSYQDGADKAYDQVHELIESLEF